MNIYHQIGQEKDARIDRYQIKRSIKKITINESIEHILFEQKDNKDSVFLIDESYFSLVRCPIAWQIYEPLTLQQLTNLITNKSEEIKKTQHIHGYMMMYDIDNIFIDEKPSSFILGEKGYISRDIFFIFIKPSLAINSPNLLKKDQWPLLYPSSYFTVQFMVKTLQINSFVTITFEENNCKLIVVKDWFYHTIRHLDRGFSQFKQILISNNIIQYFAKTDDEIANNPMAQSVLLESINFFHDILIKWIEEHNEWITTGIVNIPHLKNSLFYNEFTKLYSKHIWGYIVQASIDPSLHTYDRQRQMSELDILTYLNFSETKELI